MVELITQPLILENILWLPLCRINKFGFNTLPSKTVAIPYTCGLSERRYEIQQEIRARQAMCAARIAVGLPPDSSKPEEEELAPMQVEEAELSEQQLPGFNMEQTEAKFAVARSDEIAEPQAILESIQDESYVVANRAFLQQE